MFCNISLITIILLIVIIIGLVAFSNYKTTEEGFGATTEALLPQPFDGAEQAKIINDNNEQINTLINQLQSINPEVKLINYDSNSVYLDVQNNVTSNITKYMDELNKFYNTGAINNSNKIAKLETTLSDLEKIVNNLGLSELTNKTYNTIKSLNNGMEMKLISTPNTVFKDYKTGSNIAGYMVMANNGCLSVGATDYDIYQCNDKNPKQIFKMEHILNETAYQNNIDTSLPIDNTDKSNINYPFVMMKSINNENCLTNNHGNLTVQPCYSFVAQRWFPM